LQWRACDCVGASYLKPGERVAVVLADPASAGKSNRMIAMETGASEGTVRNIRNSTAQNYAVERTVGLDGKERPAPRSRAPALGRKHRDRLTRFFAFSDCHKHGNTFKNKGIGA
jgi:hypothetical protein